MHSPISFAILNGEPENSDFYRVPGGHVDLAAHSTDCFRSEYESVSPHLQI